MTRVLADYTIGGLLIVVLVVGGYSIYLSQRLDHEKEVAQDSKAEATGYKVYATEHKKVAAEKEKTYVEVEEALQRHVEWADVPVPDELADQLRDRDSKRVPQALQ
jgi:hypothetical protein